MALAQADNLIWTGMAGLLMLTLLALQFLLACGSAAAILWASYRLGRPSFN